NGAIAVIAVTLAGALLVSGFGLTTFMGQEYLPSRIATASGMTVGLTMGFGGVAAVLLGVVADSVDLRTALLVTAAAPAVGALVAAAPESFGKLTGTATVAGTPGLGKVGKLKIGGSVAIPAAIGRWTGQVVPIPLGSNLNLGPDVAGIFGAAVLVVQPSDLEE